MLFVIQNKQNEYEGYEYLNKQQSMYIKIWREKTHNQKCVNVKSC